MIDPRTLLALLADADGRNPRRDGSYAVSELPDPSLGWIGCGSSAYAAFLLRVEPQIRTPHGLHLSTVTVRHGVRVVIDDGTQLQEAEVSLVECTAQDRPTIELFVRCIGSVLGQQGGPLSGDAIAGAMQRLLELFRAVTHATDAEILGLWSELALITHSRDPSAMVDCWRLQTMSRFDFGTAAERLDVKATTRPYRHHELSFDQAGPPPGTTAAFVSMITERVSSGVSVGQLWDEVLRLAPSHHDKVDRVCVATLGRDWQLARAYEYDLQRALASLRVYPSTSVPKLVALPAGVLHARFVSDFERGTQWNGPPPSRDGPIALAIDCSNRHSTQRT